MVGRRPRAVNWPGQDRKIRPVFPCRRRPRATSRRYRDDDEEAAVRPSSKTPDSQTIHRNSSAKGNDPRDYKGRKALRAAERRRVELKCKVLDGMRGFDLDELDQQFRKSDEELRKIRNKKVRRFYRAQNETLDAWIEVDAVVYAVADDVIESMNPDADRDGVAERRMPLQDSRGAVDAFLPPEHLEKRARNDRHARWAINVNVIANVVMLVAKLISLRFSPSLSLVASTADSALDLFCTLIVYSTNRVVAWRLRALQLKYPVGRRRLEPIGILVFSVIMVVSFGHILQESASKLLPGGDHGVAPLPPVPIGAMAGNAVIKGIIGLACRHIKTTQVQALVQDCKTDVYFNIASLLFPLIGVTADVWWLDPVGASLLAMYVIVDWAETCIRNVSHLTGSNVGDALQKKLMYLAFRFSPVVEGFKSLTAYHAGDGVWVELDILLDEATPLPTAHDIAETLQYCYEGLQEVDRAFVTIDYSTLGPTGHSIT